MEDLINHPQHYEKNKITIQPIDLIDTLNFCVGNVIKYVTRAKDKGNEIEDLKKALFYHRRSLRYFDSTYVSMIYQLAVLYYSDNELLSGFGRQIKADFRPFVAWKNFGNAIMDRLIELGEDVY